MSRRSLTLSLALLATASPAFAHPGHAETTSFLSGLLHPLLGIDHLFALIAVGLLTTRLQNSRRLKLPLTFLLMMTVGMGAGLLHLPVVGTEQGIALSLVVGGMFLALARPLPVLMQRGVAGLFALYHGVAHGSEILAGNVLVYSIGILCASALVILFTYLIGTRLSVHHSERVERFSGSIIGLTGLTFLSLAG